MFAENQRALILSNIPANIPTNKQAMAAQTINRRIELFEILYRECRRDPDVIAMVIDEYLNVIDDSKLTELEDFVANNFCD